jgi:hypothetical protein
VREESESRAFSLYPEGSYATGIVGATLKEEELCPPRSRLGKVDS